MTSNQIDHHGIERWVNFLGIFKRQSGYSAAATYDGTQCLEALYRHTYQSQLILLFLLTTIASNTVDALSLAAQSQAASTTHTDVNTHTQSTATIIADTPGPTSIERDPFFKVVDLRIQDSSFKLMRYFDPNSLNTHTGLGFGWHFNVHAALQQVDKHHIKLQLPSGSTYVLTPDNNQVSNSLTKWTIDSKKREHRKNEFATRSTGTTDHQDVIQNAITIHNRGYLEKHMDGNSTWRGAAGDWLKFKGHLPVAWFSPNGHRVNYFYQDEQLASIEVSGTAHTAGKAPKESNTIGTPSSPEPATTPQTSDPSPTARQGSAEPGTRISFEYQPGQHPRRLRRILVDGVPRVTYAYDDGNLSSVYRDVDQPLIRGTTKDSNSPGMLTARRHTAGEVNKPTSSPARVERYAYQPQHGLPILSKAFKSTELRSSNDAVDTRIATGYRLDELHNGPMMSIQEERLNRLQQYVSNVCGSDVTTSHPADSIAEPGISAQDILTIPDHADDDLENPEDNTCAGGAESAIQNPLAPESLPARDISPESMGAMAAFTRHVEVRPDRCQSYFDLRLATWRGTAIETAMQNHADYAGFSATVKWFPVVDFVAGRQAISLVSHDLAAKSYQSSDDGLYRQLLQDGRNMSRKFLQRLSSEGEVSASWLGETTVINAGQIDNLVFELIIQRATATPSQVSQIIAARKELQQQFGITLQVITIP